MQFSFLQQKAESLCFQFPKKNALSHPKFQISNETGLYRAPYDSAYPYVYDSAGTPHSDKRLRSSPNRDFTMPLFSGIICSFGRYFETVRTSGTRPEETAVSSSSW